MPVTFSKIASNTASVTFSYGGDAITVVYYPNKMTRKAITQIEASQEEDPLLIELIKSWDIYADDDMTIMCPISRIDEFGIPFKEKLIQAIAQDMRPEAKAP